MWVNMGRLLFSVFLDFYLPAIFSEELTNISWVLILLGLSSVWVGWWVRWGWAAGFHVGFLPTERLSITVCKFQFERCSRGHLCAEQHTLWVNISDDSKGWKPEYIWSSWFQCLDFFVPLPFLVAEKMFDSMGRSFKIHIKGFVRAS